MANKFRNELEITLGSEKILLRPTFENLAAMESDLGGVAFLSWKFSRGLRMENGKVDPNSVNELSLKSLPSMTETAKIIYYNQAATKPEDPTQKKYSLEEIHQMVLEEGAGACKHVILFIGKVTAGDKTAQTIDEMTPEEKKS
jgi:hypothetical protein